MKNNDNDNNNMTIVKELNYTKQVVHNAIAHHSLTDAQLVPEPRSTPPRGARLLAHIATPLINTSLRNA